MVVMMVVMMMIMMMMVMIDYVCRPTVTTATSTPASLPCSGQRRRSAFVAEIPPLLNEICIHIYIYLPLTPPPNICDVRCAGVRGDGVRPGQPRGRGAGLGRGGGLVPGQLGATVGGLREI